MLKVTFDAASAARFSEALKPFLVPPAAVMARAVANKAKSKAEAKGGRRFWHDKVAQAVEDHVLPDGGAEVTLAGADADIAAHAHFGGIIRPKKAKFLAIPIDRSVRDEYAREQPELQVIRTKDGARGRAYLIRPAKSKRGKAKFLYVLKKSVMQNPRPWWVTDEEADAAAGAAAKAWQEATERDFNGQL